MIELIEDLTGYNEDLIGNLLEEIKHLEEKIDEKGKNIPPLTFKEKKLILSELNGSIYNIEMIEERNRTKIIFYFNRINLYLDPGTNTNAVEYRKLPFYYLWKLGFINFRSSKSTVTMTITENGVSGFRSTYENNNQRNFHDWGYDCWGGWSSVINNLLNEKKFYDAVLHIASRMKQATVNDNVSSFDKMCAFEYETTPYKLLNDQEVEFFKDEIIWLATKSFTNDRDNRKSFIFNRSNNTYELNLRFQNHRYKLAVSENIYHRLIEGRI